MSKYFPKKIMPIGEKEFTKTQALAKPAETPDRRANARGVKSLGMEGIVWI